MISQKTYGDLYCIGEKIIPPTIQLHVVWLQLQGLGEIFHPAKIFGNTVSLQVPYTDRMHIIVSVNGSRTHTHIV